jgi:hypothetical protein
MSLRSSDDDAVPSPPSSDEDSEDKGSNTLTEFEKDQKNEGNTSKMKEPTVIKKAKKTQQKKKVTPKDKSVDKENLHSTSFTPDKCFCCLEHTLHI